MEMQVEVEQRIEKSSGLETDRSHDSVTVKLEGSDVKAVLELKIDAAKRFKTGSRFAMVLVAKD